MTPQEMENIREQLANLHGLHVATLARLKALESITSRSLPPEQREAWYDKLDSEASRIHQKMLEEVEDMSPGWAARIDFRPDFPEQ